MLCLSQPLGEDFAGICERNPSSVTITYGEPDDPLHLQDLTANGRVRIVQPFGRTRKVQFV